MAHGQPHDVLAALVDSARYDYIFHGPSHRRRHRRNGRTRVINLGALTGKFPYMHSIAILDPAADEGRFLLV